MLCSKKQSAESTERLNDKLFLQGFLNMVDGKVTMMLDSVPMTQQLAQQEVNQRIQKITEEREAVEYAAVFEAGQEFLAAKAQEKGVIALEGGVLCKELQAGKPWRQEAYARRQDKGGLQGQAHRRHRVR